MTAVLRIAVIEAGPVAEIDDRLVEVSVSWPVPGR